MNMRRSSRSVSRKGTDVLNHLMCSLLDYVVIQISYILHISHWKEDMERK